MNSVQPSARRRFFARRDFAEHLNASRFGQNPIRAILLPVSPPFRSLSRHGHISSPKLEQDLATAIRFQGFLERFLELVERVHMVHCGGERSISYEVSQLLVNLLDLCARRVAYPIDEPESV